MQLSRYSETSLKLTLKLLTLKESNFDSFGQSLFSCLKGIVVGSSGLEPPTSRLSGARSNQLSYEPIFMVEMSGFEPLASCLQGRRSPN